jgi:hypothetical protein
VGRAFFVRSSTADQRAADRRVRRSVEKLLPG